MTRARTIGIVTAGALAIGAMGLAVANLMGLTSRPATPPPPNAEAQAVASMLCGPHALHHLAEYHERPSSVAQIAEWARTDDEGTTMLGLVNASQALGFEAQGWEARPVDLLRVRTPVIAHFTSLHWVVVEVTDRENVTFWDPVVQETRTVSLSEFRDLWSGYLLTVAPAD